MEEVKHVGSCHCENVKIEIVAPESIFEKLKLKF